MYIDDYLPINKEFEGESATMYLDTEDNVTVARGLLLATALAASVLPFLDAQEFYNDFNDYTLNVTVPKNYIVWATGTLQNPKQVLQPEYAKRLEKSFTSDSRTASRTRTSFFTKLPRPSRAFSRTPGFVS